ncbi:MAG: 7-carboxy-7-deazaguanine synthase QueE [Syntrophales bacterium]
MRISETFYSLQGEGILTGQPSVFIRTAGCNLHCRWCDSAYAARQARGEERTIDSLVAEVHRYPTRFCVITGGEPMLAEGIHELAKRLVACGRHVTIETAATLAPDGIACSLASLSPKLSNSTPDVGVSEAVRIRHEAQRLQPDALRDWIDHYNYQLKFVVCSPSDIDEILDLLEKLGRNIPPERVLLMPEGVEPASLTRAAENIIPACKEHGFRFCDRLQIRLYGNKRGR